MANKLGHNKNNEKKLFKNVFPSKSYAQKTKFE
jgi:hypothetical protein